MINRIVIRVWLGCVWAIVIHTQSVNAFQSGQPDTGKTPPAVEQPSTDKPSEKKKEQVLAVVGGDIQTVTRGVIRNGTILIRDGKIAEIGQQITIPEGAERIDATGKIITPGFVAISMQGVGLAAGGGGFGGRRGGGGGEGESGASGDLADSLDPFDRNLKIALAVGITSGCSQVGGGQGGGRRRRDPQQPFVGLDPDPLELENLESETEQDFGGEVLPTCPCCGLTYLPMEPIEETPPPRQEQRQFVVVKMSYGSLDGMLAKQNVFVDGPAAGLSTAQARHDWREQFKKAREYLKQMAEHEAAIRAGERKQPPRNPVSEEFLKLVKKEIPLRVVAESVSQIRDMIVLAKELDYRLVIERGTEGWAMADELSDAGVSVIITPRLQRQPDFGKESSTGSFAEMPKVLSEAGVPFATAALANSISLNGLAGRDLTSLPLEALFAIRGGASELEALKSITIIPAKMLGMDDRIGSLEVGKDGDLLILDGSPMDYRSYVEQAIVNGRKVYDRNADRILPVFSRN